MFEQARAIITGGSSGLGKLLAERLLAAGAEVVLVARDAAKLEATRDELLATQPGSAARLHVRSCDVSHFEEVQRAFDALAAELGAPTLLINSAGVLSEGPFERTSLDTFHELMNVNFFGIVHTCRAALPHMRRAGGGRIVNVSSMAGLLGVYGYSAYCASKHAIGGFSSALRMELRPENVHVHLACPPEFDSPMIDALNRVRTPENRAITLTIPPMRVDDVADAILRGIRREQYEIIVGTPARLVRLGDRLFPAVSRRIADRRLAAVRRDGAAQ